MNLEAKIKPEYLDAILAGEKDCEFREMETITLTDGKRTKTFVINAIVPCSLKQAKIVYDAFDNVPWKRDCPLVRIDLGGEVFEL